ncbi:ATP-binding protein [Pseudokineococcus basanitobsidens]|uniref:ATP-binding protein n=1 Tax=Pseudokineococcus basanitobsidens TaxID=1926649 RepID=A0ABU8RMP2_9ACTN
MTSTATSRSDGPLVVLMCGVAGSGKTAYAQSLERQGHVRLSIDEEVWRRFGRYDVDYDESDYASFSQIAEEALCARLLELIADGRDVVLDLSFWRRASREQYKRLIESAGGRWRLVYLQAEPYVLRQRLAERAQRFDANAAFPITEEVLAGFLSGFEEPCGEGEEIVLARP